jgi:molybdopterin synthase catalytic subunit
MSDNKVKRKPPSLDEWLKEAKAQKEAARSGMFLLHNGVVRETPKAQVRQGLDDGSVVTGMVFSYDAAKVDEVIAQTYKMEGIFHVKVWLNEGQLEVGDDIMYVLIGGDIRPHVIDALQFLVGKIKNECVTEIEQKS